MTHLKPMPIAALPTAETRQDNSALAVLGAAQRAGELVHLEHIPGQPGQPTSWPESVRTDVAAALAARGIASPWEHQAQAAALVRSGRHVIIATRAASVADPAACARALTGLEAVAVTNDGSPRAPLTFALWEPPLLHTYAEVRARRPATSEAADLLAAMVRAQVPALAFIRSRRGAETVALAARDALGPERSSSVAAYR